MFFYSMYIHVGQIFTFRKVLGTSSQPCTFTAKTKKICGYVRQKEFADMRKRDNVRNNEKDQR